MQKVTQVCRKGRGNHTVHGPCNICNCGYHAARPGESPHQRGTAFDWQGMRFPDGQEAAALGHPYYWMRQHAFEFGFRRTSQTELFHWEYRPDDFACQFDCGDTRCYQAGGQCVTEGADALEGCDSAENNRCTTNAAATCCSDTREMRL